jgi:hypothetical protein
VSLRRRVQRLLPPETGLDGPHANEVRVIGGAVTESVKVKGTLLDELPSVTEANPAGAVTEEGAVRLTAPPAGATPLRVAVQVEVPGPTTDVGLHVNEVRTTAGTVRERRVVCDELPRAAVTVAD